MVTLFTEILSFLHGYLYLFNIEIVLNIIYDIKQLNIFYEIKRINKNMFNALIKKTIFFT